MKLIKIFSVLVLVAAFISSMTNTVSAQVGPGENESFGIGVMIGEPTGISVKSWNNARSAFDIGAAWSLTESESLHMHADLLIHSWFEDTENLAFYYGFGGRIIFTDDAQAGVRVPIGLNFVFPEISIDTFVEAVPILDLTPETELAGNGAVGIRYYF